MPTAAAESKPKPLNVKQQAFVAEYCTDWNGTKAAERAGFSPKSARQIASNLLADARVQTAVAKRMELYSMSAAEAQAKLAEWGRGDVKRFLKVNEDGTMVINLAHPEAQSHLYLLRKVKQKKRTIRTESAEIEEITTEIDLHDAKDAVHKTLLLLGRYAPQKFDHSTLGQPLPGPGANIYLPDNGR